MGGRVDGFKIVNPENYRRRKDIRCTCALISKNNVTRTREIEINMLKIVRF